MNRKYGKLENETLTYAPDSLVIDGLTHFNPSEAAYNAQGWLTIHTEKPTGKVGATYSPSGWEKRDGGIYRTWTEAPIVAPVKRYSVEEVIYGLIQKNALAAVKQIVGDYWELFTMRDTLSADNEIFVAKWDELKAAIAASGALTEAEIAEILADAEVA